MTTNIANIALTGLRAAQAGLAVTANNISNQGTPGYSRQQVVLQSAMSNFSGSGYFGLGWTSSRSSGPIAISWLARPASRRRR